MSNNIPKLGSITPYKFQWELIQNIKSHIRKQLKGDIKPTPAYINSFVASGKTIVAGAVANHCHSVGAKLLILARTGELVDQDQQEVWNMDSPCSIFSASLGRKSTHFSTVVGTEGTVANALSKEFTAWIPHVILIDEAHQVPWQDVIDKGESCYSKIINHFQEINPKVCIIGMTGSPYRGIESIKGPFWKEELKPIIDRQFLVDNDFIVPTIFGYGHDAVNYNLKKSTMNEAGTKDFSNSQLEEMHNQMDLTTTQLIMNEVVEKTRDRLCVLITCAGAKHCLEALKFLPDDECAVITDKTPAKLRQQILKDHKAGLLNSRGTFRYKYIAQIGCLTTGVNLPLLDTSVLLRPVGSLTLLTQLLGRGMRLLKSEHEDAGYSKSDHLTLDYSGTMAAMHQQFNDPFLEDAVLSKTKEKDWDLECPTCQTMNSEHARRCIGPDSMNNQPDDRCGYFWSFRKCEDQLKNGLLVAKGCGIENDTAARECRNCHIQLIDPNAKLMNKSYDSGDWKPVNKMAVEVTGKNADGICITYWLDVFDENGKQEIARVMYWSISGNGKRTWTSQFVRRHINGFPFQQKILTMNAKQVVGNKAFFDVPRSITHRINEKGHSVVHGLQFSSGKTMKGDKRTTEVIT